MEVPVTDSPTFSLISTVLGAPDPGALADFYRELLGWQETTREPGWVILKSPQGGAGLAFQDESDFQRPVWPERPGEQQMMAHLDIQVDDMAAAGERVISLGATLAEFQPQDDVRVYFDPAGHPFCLFLS
jgi:catechol 2,3-dioxygenase-like lactoylglutathione lyase family enzyme